MNADEAAVVAELEIAAEETDAGACCAAVSTSKTKDQSVVNADEAAVVAQLEIAAEETDTGACCAAVSTSKAKDQSVVNADEAAVVAAQIEVAAKETDAGACCAAVSTSKTKEQEKTRKKLVRQKRRNTCNKAFKARNAKGQNAFKTCDSESIMSA